MSKKKPYKKKKPPFANPCKALDPPPDGLGQRDCKTNVYIPDDTSVAEAKAWVEFCKL